MQNKPLPENAEAEAVVIGSMILDQTGEHIAAVRDMLCSTDFFYPKHRAIYDTICDMTDAGIPVELVALPDELRKAGNLDVAGGVDYLEMLAMSVPGPSSARYHAGIVREKADARQGIALVQKLELALYEQREAPYVVFDQAVASLNEIQPHGKDRTLATLAHAVEIAGKEAIDAHDGKRPANLQTGFGDLDWATGGFAPGELVVVAADTSLGKTSLCLAFLIYLAEKASTVFYISAEMPISQVGKRILQAKGSIMASRLRSGKDLQPEDITKIYTTQGETEKWAGYVWARNPTVPEIAAKMEACERKDGKKIDLLVIDYLQLLRSTRGQSRAQQVSAIANDLKSLAVAKEIPIVLVSQFNRAGAANGNPTMHDLKESGDIENAADIIILMHRPKKPELSTDGTQAIIWLRVAKARDGRTTQWEGDNALRLWWTPSLTKFLNVAKGDYYD